MFEPRQLLSSTYLPISRWNCASAAYGRYSLNSRSMRLPITGNQEDLLVGRRVQIDRDEQLRVQLGAMRLAQRAQAVSRSLTVLNGRLAMTAFASAAFMCGSFARSASVTRFASTIVTGLPACACAGWRNPAIAIATNRVEEVLHRFSPAVVPAASRVVDRLREPHEAEQHH